MRRILTTNNFNVTVAYNSEQCFNRLKRKKPDLIILDIMMEKTGSGFDVCRKIKQNEETRNIPIIILSAIDRVHPFKFASVSGDEDWLPADIFLSKPIDARTLIQHIKRCLR